MIYSVWNQGYKSYDYYEAPGFQTEANTPAPKHLHHSKLGLTVDQAAWPLPAGVTKVGRGPFPRGRVASVHSGFAGFELDRSTTMLGLLGVSAFLLWKYVR